MKNPHGNRNDQSRGNGENGREDKYEREIVALGNAFIKKYDTRREAENEEKRKDRIWIKGTTIAAIFYTALTFVIMVIGAIQAYVSRDSEQRQLRAYVGTTPGDIEGLGQPGQRARVIRKNTGLTPAYEVGFSTAGFAVLNPGQLIPTGPGECDYINQGDNAKLFTMFPNNDIRFDLKIALKIPDEDVSAIKSGGKLFAYFGTICYKDTFGYAHYTKYCYMYSGDKLDGPHAEACLTFNDAD